MIYPLWAPAPAGFPKSGPPDWGVSSVVDSDPSSATSGLPEGNDSSVVRERRKYQMLNQAPWLNLSELALPNKDKS
ncbi:MAG: hypothetical protein N838_32335 [Thiohalocapsa sp. PB-PSB1]|nr:MAG: hypothetical protein N838_32335 [Thiohalocapsa sp. PB-PSB1]